MFLKKMLLGCVFALQLPFASPAFANDGTSFSQAVVIEANDTMKGIRAEDRWIEANMSGYQKVGQKLIQNDQGTFDIITVQNDQGEVREVYFDISKFFGLKNGEPL